MMSELLTINDVTKVYGQKTALGNANLTINQNDFVALVGMSGGGKTTLLRMIAGLEQPSTGKIEQSGQEINGINRQSRVMFQDDRLLPWMTVRDNLTFGNHQEDKVRQADELLAAVELADYGDYYPSRLSGGQKQRIALARALMDNPPLLLLDEPLGALDALTRLKMQDLIMDLTQSRQLTTVLVTHDVHEATRMANRIVVVKNSHIAQVFENPYRGSGDDKKAHQAVLAERILDEIYAEEVV
ncbi:ABC transporter ATP-binding protein [Limosilactobacillus gastricus]|uniref:ABC transporter ATP-binding protein n=1 Tax=Limosilactobacillus gastricus TaxID=227942 RepID=UPI003B8A898E